MEQETHTPDLQHPDFSSGSTPAVHLQIQAALHERKRLTGVTLTLPAETPEDEDAALRQIRCLCTAYKEKYNKAQFLLSLKTGSCFFWNRAVFPMIRCLRSSKISSPHRAGSI